MVEPFPETLYKTLIWRKLVDDVLFFMFKFYCDGKNGPRDYIPALILRFNKQKSLCSYSFLAIQTPSASELNSDARFVAEGFHWYHEPKSYYTSDSDLNVTDERFYSFVLYPQLKSFEPSFLVDYFENNNPDAILLFADCYHLEIILKMKQNDQHNVLFSGNHAISNMMSFNSICSREKYNYKPFDPPFIKYKDIIQSNSVLLIIRTFLLCCRRIIHCNMSIEMLEFIFFRSDTIYFLCKELVLAEEISKLNSEIMSNIYCPKKKLSERAKRFRQFCKNYGK